MKKNARLTEAKPSAHQQAHSIIHVAATAFRRRYGWILILTCPYCGKTHAHTGGIGPVPVGGYREAHCLGPSRGSYFLEVVNISKGGQYDDLC